MTASAANSGPNNINVSTLPAALGGYGRVVVGNASGGSDIKMGSKGGGSGGSNDGALEKRAAMHHENFPGLRVLRAIAANRVVKRSHAGARGFAQRHSAGQAAVS